MSDTEKKPTSDYEPPAGASKRESWNGVDYSATAKWIALRKKEKPAAEVFSISYVKEPADPNRPVTFTPPPSPSSWPTRSQAEQPFNWSIE